MRYYNLNSAVLLIADDYLQNKSNYNYSWEITVDRIHVVKYTGRKIYVSFNTLGVKHIKLIITDNANGFQSIYENDIYVVFPGAKSYIPTELATSYYAPGILGAFIETSII